MAEEERELAGLWPAAAGGDRRAAERLLALIHPHVVRYCRARLGADGPTAADDVAQEVGLAVLGALPRYRDTGRPFLAFVYGVAAHKVADAHRAGGRDRSQPVEEVPEEPARDGLPEDAVMSVAAGNEVRRLLDSLSERSRDIIILRVFEGLSAEETGRIVGATPGAVRVAQHRALAKLRGILEKEAEEGRS
ncbi:RNA polymerase sigma factor ShbA [Corynebacterium sp. 335C]